MIEALHAMAESANSTANQFVEVTLCKGLKFKLAPTPAQAAALNRFAGTARFAYNYGLGRKQATYKATGKGLPTNELIKEFTTLKQQPEYAWLNDVPAYIPQQAVRNLDRAFVNFFEQRAQYPKFKKKHGPHQSFRIPEKIKVCDGKVSCPKLGWIELIQSQPIEGKIRSATFSRNHLDEWFVSLTVECLIQRSAEIQVSDCTGIDLGLKDIITTSQAEKVPAPKFFAAAERKLARLNRRFSRKRKGSNNRGKARRRLANAYDHVKQQRADFTHKQTTKLIRNHQALALESLNVKGMSKTKLSKSVNDAALGEIGRQLQYKGDWYGVPVITVDRWFPSSKQCADCGAKNEALMLSDREWVCQACGCWHDRDVNAARNLRAEGLKLLAAGSTESLNACGVRVRLVLPAANGEAGISTQTR
jgi:putative transposase